MDASSRAASKSRGCMPISSSRLQPRLSQACRFTSTMVSFSSSRKNASRRMVDERAETRFARAQLALGPPQLRDVLHDAELAHGTAGLVPRDVALAVHDAHRAVGPHHAVLDVVARPAAQGDLARLGGLLSIVGMDQTHPALRAIAAGRRLHAENAAGLVGERYAAGRIVALPPADAREALRRLEPALALPEVAQRRQHDHRIAEPAADLLEEAHPPPASRPAGRCIGAG